MLSLLLKKTQKDKRFLQIFLCWLLAAKQQEYQSLLGCENTTAKHTLDIFATSEPLIEWINAYYIPVSSACTNAIGLGQRILSAMNAKFGNNRGQEEGSVEYLSARGRELLHALPYHRETLRVHSANFTQEVRNTSRTERKQKILRLRTPADDNECIDRYLPCQM